MKFGKYVEDNAIPEWAAKYIMYKPLKKKIKAIVALNDPHLTRGFILFSSPTLSCALLTSFQLDNDVVRDFEEAIYSEITKITSFYLQKEGEASDFFQRLQKFTSPLVLY
jgi:SPX domain protein involved in polyphosphate accumulation